MNVLGVHIGHDSSAALIVDGEIAADVAEERFNRIKHYCGLPIHSIDYCLESRNLAIKDIDMIAVSSIGRIEGLNYLFDFDFIFSNYRFIFIRKICKRNGLILRPDLLLIEHVK